MSQPNQELRKRFIKERRSLMVELIMSISMSLRNQKLKCIQNHSKFHLKKDKEPINMNTTTANLKSSILQALMAK
jgi:hypothetical protein